MTDRHRQNNETRADSKDRYECYLRVLEANTGGPDQPSNQPAAIKRATVGVAMGNIGYHPEDTAKSRQAAINNGDVIEIADANGRPRVCRRTVSGLRALLAELNEDEDRYRITKESVAQLIKAERE